jgi:PAS domain S-box-containing protein
MARAVQEATGSSSIFWAEHLAEACAARAAGKAGGVLILFHPGEAQLKEAMAAEEDGFPVWPIVVVGRADEQGHVVALPDEELSVASLARAIRFARRLHEARREGLRAQGDVQTLSYLVSHDLRSPMTSILTLAYLLHEGAGDEPEKISEFSKGIIDSTDELGRLIDRLCYLGRLKEDPPSQILDMGSAFRAGWQRACQETARQAPLEQPEAWPRVAGQPAWLETVWSHLLSNALQHAGPESRIRAGWETRGGQEIFWVEDNGVGVDPERVPHLLRPFQRLHLAGSPKKLGLPIARRLVEKMGGRLAYHPVATGGARFEFTLAERTPGGAAVLEGGAEGEPAAAAGKQPDWAGRISDLEQLHEATLRVARAADRSAVLREVLRAALAAVGAEKGLLFLARKEGRELGLEASQGFEAGFEDALRAFPAGQGAWGQALQRRARVVLADVQKDPADEAFRDLARAGGFRAVHAVPLQARGGRTLGVLTTHYSEARAIGERERYLMDLYAQIAADFIQRARTEEALRISEERLRRATQTGKVGVWDWDITEDRIHWTESLYSLHGIGPEDFDGTVKGFSSLVHPEDRPRVARAVKEALEDRAPYEIEFRALRPDGSILWLFTNAVVLREGDKPVRMLGATVDITPRKKAEQDLQESGSHFHAMAQNAPVAIFMKDRAGRYLMANALACRAIGRPDGVVGKTDEELLPPALAAVIRRNDEQVLREGKILECEEQVGGRYYLSTKFPLPDHEGKPQAVCGIAVDITERNLNNVSNRFYEERLQMAMAAAELGDWSWDAGTDMVTLSERAAEIFGIPSGPYMAWKDMQWMILDQDRERVVAAVQDCAQKSADYSEEYRIRRPDGGESWVSAKGRPYFSPEGRFLGIRGVVQEITRQKRDELASRRLAAIVESSDDAIVSKNLNSIVTTWNKGAERLFGYSAEEMIGQPITKIIPPEQPEEEARIMNRIRRGERIEHYETTRCCKDGRRIEVSLTVSPVRDSAGKIIGVSKIARNITEEKLQRRELQANEERFRTMADSIAQFAWITDESGWIHWFNQRWFDYTGTALEEMRGWGWQQVLHPAHAERVIQKFKRHLASGEIWEDTFPLRGKDGGYRWFLSRAVPIRGEAGRIVTWFGTNTDITEQRESTERLEEQARTALLRGDIARFLDEENLYEGLQKCAASLVTRLGVKLARFYLLNAQDQVLELAATAGLQGHPAGAPARLALGEGPIGRVAAEKKPLIRQDFTGDPDGRDAEWAKGNGIQAFAAYPVKVEDRLAGVMAMYSAAPIPEIIAADLATVGDTIGQFIERKRTEKELHAQTRSLALINRIGTGLAAELELEKLVQSVTDAAREVSGAAFGAFFYNTTDKDGEAYVLYTLSGAPREAFEKFGMPRKTPLFRPTFDGEGVVRIADVLEDPRYGQNPPHHGMPEGHLAVRSYMAVPVISRNGDVLGGLFLGHPEPNRFTEEAEIILRAMAGQAAVAIDNARLYNKLQQELEQQRKTEEALRASEQQLRLTADNALVFIAHCDRDHRYKFVNRPYAERYGLDPKEIIGRHMSEITGAEAYEQFRPYMDRALAGERVEFETELPPDAEGSKWVHGIYEPERSEQGEVLGVVGVINDITQRKQQERELEAARDQALAASKAKDDFLAALSHELRTPLNPILLLASESAENASLEPEIRECFTIIRNNVELEARLIDDLLDLSRIITGKLGLEKRNIDVHDVLNLALDTVQGDLAAKKIRLSMRQAAENHQAWGDPVRLQQVFWNILKNAVKFTPEQGSIEVSTRNVEGEKGQELLVQVRDSGIGMRPEDLGRVFELFSQGLQPQHRFGGLGLGLAIARKLIDGHEGRIWAESEGPGAGATFSVQLPVVFHLPPPRSDKRLALRQTGRMLLPVKKAAPPSRSAASPRRLKLLLVEDHEPTRDALAQLLKKRNMEVFLAGSLREARERLRAQTYDLLVSDIGLPDGSGHELMRECARDYPRMKGLALTGYGMEQDIEISRNSGFTAHLTKPVHVQALESALGMVLGKSGA